MVPTTVATTSTVAEAAPGSSTASTAPSTSSASTTTSATASTTTAVTMTTAALPTTTTHPKAVDLGLPNLKAAYNALTVGNLAVSVTILRDHKQIFASASGEGVSDQAVTPHTPMVLASVSKLITALTIARLVDGGAVRLDQPVPWDKMGIAHDPAWDDVTVHELLTHTSGMPIAQKLWLNTPGSCAIPLAEAMAAPPTPKRGTWVYSNGNYCALGLLIEAVSHTGRDDVAQSYVFDPLHIEGPHLTTEPSAKDGPYALGVARLERLGGAGTWMASTDDIATMLDHVTAADRETLVSPGIITDQYGWGHTGTVDGARACAWVLEGGRTVVTAFVAGQKPFDGGHVCDALIPALATDLGIWADKPVRYPD